jgi:N-acetylmuramic acid 6-phosphate etherase
MVNVVADNAKLRDRASRIVAALSRESLSVSRRALEMTGGAVKPAVLVARGRTMADALKDLERSAGHLAPHLK